MSEKCCTFALALEGDAEIVLQPSISMTVLCMEIDHLSGKEAIELVRAHKGQ